MNLKEKSKEYLEKYKVEDVINEGMNYLFILESPHKAEINNGYPVAGNSGVEMTKFIYSQKSNEPFGKLVSNIKQYQDNYKGLDEFGIMNVVSAPMQASALEKSDLTDIEKNILHILGKLRINYQAQRHRSQEWNKVKTILINNFALRLNNIISRQSLDYIVPCGKLAQSYLKLAIKNKDITIAAEVINDIPHPSRNQWRQYSSMSKLEAVLKENIYLK